MDNPGTTNDKIAELTGVSAVQVARILRIFDNRYRTVFFERFWSDVESAGGSYNAKIEFECIESWDTLREEVLSDECSIRAAYDYVGRFRGQLLAVVDNLNRKKNKQEPKPQKPPRVPVAPVLTGEDGRPLNPSPRVRSSSSDEFVPFTRHLATMRPELLACIDEEYHTVLDDSVRAYMCRYLQREEVM